MKSIKTSSRTQIDGHAAVERVLGCSCPSCVPPPRDGITRQLCNNIMSVAICMCIISYARTYL